MLLLVTCNMPMYTICNFVCTCMFFSKNKITKKKHVNCSPDIVSF